MSMGVNRITLSKQDLAAHGIKRDQISVPGYEQVIRYTEPTSGLDAIIAIHSTTLGQAMGGCRMYPYTSFEAALEDVLRLSKGMTYKNALAGVAFGGGKAVLIGNPKTDKTPELLQNFAFALENMGGVYITAEDVGTTVDDMTELARYTSHVAGGRDARHGSGDPSPYTAYGVYAGIRAALSFRLKQFDLHDVRVCVLGLGNVGFELCRLLHKAGARLTVSDIDPEKVQRARRMFNAAVVEPAEAHKVHAEVFAPCALGGIINPHTVEDIQAPIVAGAANNQLAAPKMGDRLHERNILYAPDYVINSGGVIRVALVFSGEWDKDIAYDRTAFIEHRLLEIFHRAEREDRPTYAVAKELALQILAEARHRMSFREPA